MSRVLVRTPVSEHVELITFCCFFLQIKHTAFFSGQLWRICELQQHHQQQQQQRGHRGINKFRKDSFEPFFCWFVLLVFCLSRKLKLCSSLLPPSLRFHYYILAAFLCMAHHSTPIAHSTMIIIITTTTITPPTTELILWTTLGKDIELEKKTLLWWYSCILTFLFLRLCK